MCCHPIAMITPLPSGGVGSQLRTQQKEESHVSSYGSSARPPVPEQA